jgi:hypothetical protein
MHSMRSMRPQHARRAGVGCGGCLTQLGFRSSRWLGRAIAHLLSTSCTFSLPCNAVRPHAGHRLRLLDTTPTFVFSHHNNLLSFCYATTTFYPFAMHAVRPHAGHRLWQPVRHAGWSGGQQRCACSVACIFLRAALLHVACKRARSVQPCSDHLGVPHCPALLARLTCRHPVFQSSTQRSPLCAAVQHPSRRDLPPPHCCCACCPAGILFSEAALKGSHFVHPCSDHL